MLIQTLISLAAIFYENALFSLFPQRKVHMTKVDLTIKRSRSVQGHHFFFFFFANFKGLETLMLYTKFQRNLSIGSEEEDVFRMFTMYGRGSHFGHVTRLMKVNFHYLFS